MLVAVETGAGRPMLGSDQLLGQVTASAEIVELSLDERGNLRVGLVAIEAQAHAGIVHVVMMTLDAVLLRVIGVGEGDSQHGSLRVGNNLLGIGAFGNLRTRGEQSRRSKAERDKENAHFQIGTAFKPTKRPAIAATAVSRAGVVCGIVP